MVLLLSQDLPENHRDRVQQLEEVTEAHWATWMVVSASFHSASLCVDIVDQGCEWPLPLITNFPQAFFRHNFLQSPRPERGTKPTSMNFHEHSEDFQTNKFFPQAIRHLWEWQFCMVLSRKLTSIIFFESQQLKWISYPPRKSCCMPAISWRLCSWHWLPAEELIREF